MAVKRSQYLLHFLYRNKPGLEFTSLLVLPTIPILLRALLATRRNAVTAAVTGQI